VRPSRRANRAGGGVALIRASSALEKLTVSDEERFGVKVVKRAIEEPLRWISNQRRRRGLDRPPTR